MNELNPKDELNLREQLCPNNKKIHASRPRRNVNV
jgi:hypothetical protein